MYDGDETIQPELLSEATPKPQFSLEEIQYEDQMLKEAMRLSMLEAGKDAPDPNLTKIDFSKPYSWYEVLKILSEVQYVITDHYDGVIVGPCAPEKHTTPKGQIIMVVNISVVAAYGDGSYTLVNESKMIPMYPGKKSFMDLPVRPYQESTDEFVARGHKFEELTKKPSYRYAKGKIYVPNQMSRDGFNRIPIDGRIMIDPLGYQRHASADRWHQQQEHEKIPDEMYQSTLSTVPIFSFEHRMWGEVPVDQISEIEFDKTAFDRTVIPQKNKDMIRRLVTNFYKTECQNFIKGKGRGLVFLLHGKPGVGKTLTAHGISELLGLPLYSVGTGDLGTDPREIENKLKRIFQMVEHWNGIVLLDEADVFMPKRTDYDVMYNACVSVFLRLIETYSGILFLTTNRDHQIDEAFKSRIHIPLHYHELEAPERELVWSEALRRHGVEGLDVTRLAKPHMNNREIANCVENAFLEAGGDPKLVTEESIENYIELRKNFGTGDVQ